MPRNPANPLDGPFPGKDLKDMRGRLSAPRALKYLWYRDIEGFESCATNLWWDEIEWGLERRANKAKRSDQPGIGSPRMVHAGFIWEAVRRMPDFETLLAGYQQLSGKDLVEGIPIPEKYCEISKNFAEFMRENGIPVIDALDILSEHWKQNFGNLPQNVKDAWQACYLAFWKKVGESGSVPRIPADLPKESETGYFSGQGRTAFDLLSYIPGGGPRRYEEYPLPYLFLSSFAKFLVVKEKDEERSESVAFSNDDISKREGDFVLRFGFIEQHLEAHNMHPLALAVDLSKSTELILRDLKKIVEEKRESLRICVADRRIKMESFLKIGSLDKEVFMSERALPFTKTVKEFENSIRIDLSQLITSIKVACGEDPIDAQAKEPSKKEIKKILAELRERNSGNSVG